jgi:hypothetical protein
LTPITAGQHVERRNLRFATLEVNNERGTFAISVKTESDEPHAKRRSSLEGRWRASPALLPHSRR